MSRIIDKVFTSSSRNPDVTFEEGRKGESLCSRQFIEQCTVNTTNHYLSNLAGFYSIKLTLGGREEPGPE